MAYFGTDGIRDVAGQGRLSPESVERIGAALADFAADQAGRAARIAVGRDPRPSGGAIVRRLAAGMRARGATVEDVGLVPTPAIAWMVAMLGYDLGCAISASHNPEPYNGVKPFAPGGRKLTEEEEADVEARIRAARVVGGGGDAVAAPDAAARYVESTIAELRSTGDLRGVRLVVDLAAGATSATAPAVLDALGARVRWLHPAGERAINDGCGTEHPQAWLAALRAERADGGLAFDGDGDRVLVADAGGRVLDGDHLLTALALDAKGRGALPGDVVVTTVMSNLGLDERLEAAGIRVERVAVGDRNVAARMRRNGAALGAEPSGHVVLPRDGALIGDALVAGVRVLQAVARSGRSLAEARDDLTIYPQVLRSIPVRERRPLEDWADLSRAIGEAEAALRPGRVLVRYSGTEPVLRIMAEGRDAATVEQAVSRIEAEALRAS
jgi:phosphoglucosamine mutase